MVMRSTNWSSPQPKCAPLRFASVRCVPEVRLDEIRLREVRFGKVRPAEVRFILAALSPFVPLFDILLQQGDMLRVGHMDRYRSAGRSKCASTSCPIRIRTGKRRWRRLPLTRVAALLSNGTFAIARNGQNIQCPLCQRD